MSRNSILSIIYNYSLGLYITIVLAQNRPTVIWRCGLLLQNIHVKFVRQPKEEQKIVIYEL